MTWSRIGAGPATAAGLLGQVGLLITFGQYVGLLGKRGRTEADRWAIHQHRLYFYCLSVFGAIPIENMVFSTLKTTTLAIRTDMHHPH